MGIMSTGRHDARVIRTGLIDDSEGKTPAVSVQFENATGDTITAYLFLSEKAWEYTQEKLATLGWEAAKQGGRFEQFNDDPSPIVGHDAEIVIEPETFEGKTRNKVKYINPIGGRLERMEPAAAMSFAARLRARLGVGGASAPVADRRLPRQASTAKPAPENDDIPF